MGEALGTEGHAEAEGREGSSPEPAEENGNNFQHKAPRPSPSGPLRHFPFTICIPEGKPRANALQLLQGMVSRAEQGKGAGTNPFLTILGSENGKVQPRNGGAKPKPRPEPGLPRRGSEVMSTGIFSLTDR